MPKRSIRPPMASIAAGTTSRRSVIAEAPKITNASPLAAEPFERARQRVRLVGDALLGDDRSAGGGETRLQNAQSPGDDARPETGQHSRGDSEAQGAKRRDRNGSPRGQAVARRRQRRARRGERNDLDCRRHVAHGNDAEWRQRRNSNRLVNTVNAANCARVDNDQTGGAREQIDSASERRFEIEMGAGKSLGETPGRFVLTDVAGLQPGDDNFPDPRLAQCAAARSAVMTCPFLRLATEA